ncbi:hypothetical protein [Rhodococcus yananensis]
MSVLRFRDVELHTFDGKPRAAHGMIRFMAGSASHPSPHLSVGTAVVVRAGVVGDDAEPGKIVADYGPHQEAVGDQLGRDWAPVKRWAVALDNGRLVFVDDNDLETSAA